MMEKAISSASVSGNDCCARCQYYEAHTSCCRCIDSPLEGRVVDPSGYCLEYIGLGRACKLDYVKNYYEDQAFCVRQKHSSD